MAHLHIIAACTDRKRGAVRAHLRDHARGPDRARRWRKALDAAATHAVRAENLYIGNHWAAVRSLTSSAASRGWAHTDLWVASAGYGLVGSEYEVVPYGATFTSGHPDSVIDPRDTGAPEEQTRAWWNELTKRRKSIASLVNRDPEGAVLFVGSRHYVDAAAEDLVRSRDKLARCSRLVIVTGALPRESELHPYVVIPPARVRAAVGGPLTALHARTAQRLLASIVPSRWSAEHARSVVSRLAASAPELERPEREPLTDRDVTAFVRRAIASDRTLSATRALRLLRDSGKACEQKRFKNLFEVIRRAS